MVMNKRSKQTRWKSEMSSSLGNVIVAGVSAPPASQSKHPARHQDGQILIRSYSIPISINKTETL